MVGVSSSGLSWAWTHRGDARAITALRKGRADSRQRIVLILGLVVGEFRGSRRPCGVRVDGEAATSKIQLRLSQSVVVTGKRGGV